MKTRRLPFMMLLATAALAAGCENGPAQNPETTSEPSGEASSSPPATDTGTASTSTPPATQTSTPTSTPAPAPKPGKDKIVGKWQFSFEGEPKTKAEDELKKKFAKEKDTTKFDAEMKKRSDAAGGEWIEFADGTYSSHVTEKEKDKVVLKVKYEVAKDEGSTLTLKPAKDEKAMKEEITITFVSDDTITMVDPKKKMTLTFKRKS